MLSVVALASPQRGAPGNVDSSFGHDGAVAVALAPTFMENFGSEGDALAVEPDGDVVVGGNERQSGRKPHAWLVRLTAGGSLDPSFGTDLYVELQPGFFFALASGEPPPVVQKGPGEVVPPPPARAGGYVESLPNLRILHVYYTPAGLVVPVLSVDGKLGLERYSVSGTAEDAGGSGTVSWLAVPGRALDATVDTNGRVTVLAEEGGRMEIARFSLGGVRNRRFGRDGISRLDMQPLGKGGGESGAESVGLATERDGSVVTPAAVGLAHRFTKRARIALVRLTPSGRLDRSFGVDGMAHVPSALSEVDALAIAPEGQIVVAGIGRRSAGAGLPGKRSVAKRSTGRRSAEENDLVVARYTNRGALDGAFGRAGVVRTSLGVGTRTQTAPHAIAFDGEGNALVVGERSQLAVDTTFGEWFLVRYTIHGRDCSFGTRGVAYPQGDASPVARAVATQPNGDIVVTGGTKTLDVMRYVGGGKPRTCA